MSEFLQNLVDPEAIIRIGGLAAVCAVIFAESGLLVGFFFPGDSLLFLAGFLTSPAGGELLPPLYVVIPLIVLSAIAGDQVGYSFGKRVGASLLNRPDGRFFTRERFDRAASFMDKYGPRAIVLARFVPIVRTFTPIAAGVTHLNRQVFTRYNIVGGTIWGIGVPLLGAWLGQFELVEENLEIAAIVIVFISILPILFHIIADRRARRISAQES